MPLLRAALTSIPLALVAAAPALAADGEGTKLDLQQEAPRAVAGQAGSSTGGGLVRTIVGLAIVIAVIYGLTWVLKQVKRSREDAASGTGLATLATLPLGPKGSLHLVRAGEEVVLLGAGDGGVTAIRTYRAAEARALGLIEPDAPADVPLDPPADDVPGTLTLAEPQPAKGGSLLEALRKRTVIR